MNRWTDLVSTNPCPDDPHRPSSTPIYQTATFTQPSADGGGRFDYTRSGNPTRASLQAQLARLEGTRHAFAYSSGMAAIAAVTDLLRAGDHVVAGQDIYGGTHRLLTQVLSRRGIEVSLVDTSRPDTVTAALSTRTRLILAETPSNPLLRISDVARLAEIARGCRALLAIDNTLVSPWLQQPAALGADLVVCSATKHLGGHGDVTAGVVATDRPDLAGELAFLQNAQGTGLGPQDSWLLSRGIATLPLRIERQQASAITLAHWLSSRRDVSRVHFPGLVDHPGRGIHARQARGPGSLISFETGNVELSRAVVEQTQLFSISVSFGSVHSSISLPCRMSHASIPDGERSLAPDLVRVSVGIEDPQDLVADLERAFAVGASSGPDRIRGGQPRARQRSQVWA